MPGKPRFMFRRGCQTIVSLRSLRFLRVAFEKRLFHGNETFSPRLNADSAIFVKQASRESRSAVSHNNRFWGASAIVRNLCKSSAKWELGGLRMHSESPHSQSTESAVRGRSGPQVAGFSQHTGEEHAHLSSYVKALELALRRRGYSLIRTVALCASILAMGVAIYWNRFIEWGSEQGAGVASRTLEDELVRLKARELAAELVQQLIHDEKTFDEFLSLLISVLNSDESKKAVRSLLHEVTSSLLSDEELRRKFNEMLAASVQSDAVKASAARVGTWLLGHEQLQGGAKSLSRSVLENSDVQREAGALAWAAFKSGFLGLHPRPLEDQKMVRISRISSGQPSQASNVSDADASLKH